jgi:hypothetical protein
MPRKNVKTESVCKGPKTNIGRNIRRITASVVDAVNTIAGFGNREEINNFLRELNTALHRHNFSLPQRGRVFTRDHLNDIESAAGGLALQLHILEEDVGALETAQDEESWENAFEDVKSGLTGYRENYKDLEEAVEEAKSFFSDKAKRTRSRRKNVSVSFTDEHPSKMAKKNNDRDPPPSTGGGHGMAFVGTSLTAKVGN